MRPAFLALLLTACSTAGLPAAPEACGPGEPGETIVAAPGVGWTETYDGTFGEEADLYVRELTTGARRDFRLTAWAGYDAQVEVRATCLSGLLRCYGLGPVYSDEHGGAVVDGETCVGSEQAVAWLVVGCSDPAEEVLVEVEVSRRQDRDACAYELAVSLVPES